MKALKPLLIPITITLGVLIFFFNLKDTPTGNDVVIYVAHDQDYSQPILEEFEKETGIKVNAVYDTEASKTVGLVNRLIAEKNNPQADVFWNNEVVRTIQLKKEGVLEPYKPKNYDLIDSTHKDSEEYWTGFAARARVLIVNTNLVEPELIPSSLEDLTNSKFSSQITLADPRFGTNGPHLAALYNLWGQEKFEDYFLTLKKLKLNIAQSNGQTRDKVVNGEKWIGFTDTDDVNDAIQESKPIKMIYPDQKETQIGTLVIPNSVMLIKGAKNSENAKKLIDYLISPEVESKLSFAKSAQMPLLPGVDRPENVPDVKEIKAMQVDWEKISDYLPTVLKFTEEYLLD